MTESVLKTYSVPVSCGSMYDGLLSVNGGQEAVKALESASLLLDTVARLLDNENSEEERSHITGSAATLVHIAKALIDSIGWSAP